MRVLILLFLCFVAFITCTCQPYSLIPLDKNKNFKLLQTNHGFDLLEYTHKKTGKYGYQIVNECGVTTNHSHEYITKNRLDNNLITSPDKNGNFWGIDSNREKIRRIGPNGLYYWILPKNKKNLILKKNQNNIIIYEKTTSEKQEFKSRALSENEAVPLDFAFNIYSLYQKPKQRLMAFTNSIKNTNLFHIFINSKEAASIKTDSPLEIVYISDDCMNTILFNQKTGEYQLCTLLEDFKNNEHVIRILGNKPFSEFKIPEDTFCIHHSVIEIDGMKKNKITVFYGELYSTKKTKSIKRSFGFRHFILDKKEFNPIIGFEHSLPKPYFQNLQIILALKGYKSNKYYIATSNSQKWVTGNELLEKHLIPNLRPTLDSNYEFVNCTMDEARGNYSILLKNKFTHQYSILRLHIYQGFFQCSEDTYLNELNSSGAIGDLDRKGNRIAFRYTKGFLPIDIFESLAPGKKINNKRILNSTCIESDAVFLSDEIFFRIIFNLEFDDFSSAPYCFISPDYMNPGNLPTPIIFPGNCSRIFAFLEDRAYGTIETENGTQLCSWEFKSNMNNQKLHLEIPEPHILEFKLFKKGECLIPAAVKKQYNSGYDILIANHYVIDKNRKSKYPTVKAAVLCCKKGKTAYYFYLPSDKDNSYQQVIANKIYLRKQLIYVSGSIDGKPCIWQIEGNKSILTICRF